MKQDTGQPSTIPSAPILLILLSSCSFSSYSHSSTSSTSSTSTAYSNCHTRALALANTTEIRLIRNP
jgi:hypothetical protein